jgi:hypothetical protein
MSGDLPDEAKIRKDLLWGMYTDLRAHARHAETLRANVINVTIVVASVLVAVITNDGHVGRNDFLMCLAVAIVGLFGLAFAASYTELHERNRRRALRVRDELEHEYFDATTNSISSLLSEADAVHRASKLYRRGRLLPGSTQRFWLLLPGLVMLAGVVLATVAI